MQFDNNVFNPRDQICSDDSQHISSFRFRAWQWTFFNVKSYVISGVSKKRGYHKM